MAMLINGLRKFHDSANTTSVIHHVSSNVDVLQYEFQNFFHPFVGKLIAKLNASSVAGMLAPAFLAGCTSSYGSNEYTPNPNKSAKITAPLDQRKIDVGIGGPYANYNWELLYHIPVTVAVNLSNNQRFAEAQKWFHLVFDPTNADVSVAVPQRFWKSFVFRGDGVPPDLASLLQLLDSTDPSQAKAKADVTAGYDGVMANPFDPFVVARSRPSAFQWYVVMKYLDNLIAWGDGLFLQDTIETINEATLCYVLAANVLGPRPQSMPQPDASSPRNYLQLQQAGLDAMSNALVDLESQFPFNLAPPSNQGAGASSDQSGALFGIGRSLYFCIPQNQTLLAYWDTVADRLFKIRNSENIQGVVQQLPLFDPPLDPGMLVMAAAAGIDIGSVVSGLNQPIGPVRSLFLIQKALELAAEVRSLGNALLSALEKGDAERLAALRQSHEIELQKLVQNVRFLQWRHAQETTTGLLKSRASALERYTYYLRLLGLTPDGTTAPNDFNLDRRELTEANFDDAYNALVGKYDLSVALQGYSKLQLAQGSSPSSSSGASGTGQLYLNTNEDAELNSLLPTARDTGLAASVVNAAAAPLSFIPDVGVNLHYWGLGGHMIVFGGSKLAVATTVAADVLQMESTHHREQAAIAGRTAGYQRRADDWMLQANLAARELMSIGRQIIASLIGEQVAYHDYQNVKAQVKQAQQIQSFLQDKFTSAQFYAWMQGELSGLYHQYYRFACDTARRAEQTMKQELMRPELDQTQFIQFNYWDSGHKGLTSGDALFLDVKRMELAYHDNNKRELEITRHVSLRQLNPVALLTLWITGACTVTIPEWLYDLDCPGHYLRRIKTVALSIPSVTGPYTGVNCTLTLQSSSVRTSPLLANNVYARNATQDDDRFVDNFGSTDVIVTSTAANDSGMFETNLRDERFLPFEGAGAISTWTLSLPSQLCTFDYSTISDVILHVRYTAREAGEPLASQATKELIKTLMPKAASQSLMFCLRFDFPTEWSAFVNGTANFQVVLEKSYFPYFVQGASLTMDGVRLYAAAGSGQVASVTYSDQATLSALTKALGSASASAPLSLPVDSRVLQRDQQQLVFMILEYHFQSG